jgi:hypothetical protein
MESAFLPSFATISRIGPELIRMAAGEHVRI